VKSTANRVERVRANLLRAMRAVEREASPKSVHLLRTSCRRLDVVLVNTAGGNGKLRQRLRSLRRDAGKVRDLDVQLATLASVQLASVAEEQQRVTRRLERKRSRKAQKLRQQMAAQREKTARQVKRFFGRLEPAEIPSEKLLCTALDQFLDVAHQHQGQNDAAELHALRIAGKKARYLAEMAEPKLAQPAVKEFKRIQNAIGAWLDWEMLIGAAQKALKDPVRSPLLSALRGEARSRMLHAHATLREVSERLREIHSALQAKTPSKAGIKKSPARASAGNRHAAGAA
jgi:CHAD domain-containing protein